MNHLQIRQFLKALSSDPGPTYANEEWITAPCPLAPWTHDSGKDSNPSFAINCKPGGESHFHCFTCKSGDLLYLIQLLKGYGAQKPKYNIAEAMKVLMAEEDEQLTLEPIKEFDEPPPKKDVVIPWDEEWLDMFKPATLVPKAREYLYGRNVSEGMQKYLDIRWDLPRECVAFPIRDWGGRLVGLRGRRIAGGYYDYGGPHDHRNKLVWYGEDRVSPDERPVVFVESVFDVASVARCYRRVLAPLTVGMSRSKVMRMAGCLEIVTLFDNGAGGDKARGLVDKYLAGGRSILHLKPPTGCSDPGDMTEEQVCNLLNGVAKLPLDSAI